MRQFFLILVVTALPLMNAHADDCADATTQTAMNQCAAEEFQKADAQLNAAYKEIRARLKGDHDTLQRLMKAEKAWLAFRDAECDFSTSGSVDGSAYPMLVAMCRTGLTKARVDGLKSYLNCEEGDLSCPVPAQ